MFCLVSQWRLVYFNPTAQYFMTHTHTYTHWHKCQTYVNHTQSIDQNCQRTDKSVMHYASKSIFLVENMHTDQDPLHCMPFFYYRIPFHAVQTQHGLYLKTAFLYFASSITSETCICIYMMWLIHQILSNMTFSKEIIDFLLDFSVPEWLTNANSQIFTMPWRNEDGSTSIHSILWSPPGCLLAWKYI